MVASDGQQARANGHNVQSYDTGMCQKYVRDQCWRVPSLYGSAIEAWNGAKQKHPGDRTPPVGAPVYYRGGQYGHAVIYCGGDHKGIRSTDCDTAWEVSDASLDWPERAWGYEYLGWTGDINGVDLPLGGGGDEEEDEVKEADIEAIASRVNRTLGDWNSDGQAQEGSDGKRADQRLISVENKVKDLQDLLEKVWDKVK